MDIAINIAPGQRYIVINDSLTYNAVVQTVGSEFVGMVGVTTYTGTGAACEILQVNASGIEAYLLEDPAYPERLMVNESFLEIIKNTADVIFPEKLTLFSSSLEYGGYKKAVQPQIVYCRN